MTTLHFPIAGGALLLMAALARLSYAADLAAVPSAETEVRLVEIAESAEYREYGIVIADRGGSTTITTVKDGARTEGTLPPGAATELWRFLLDKGVVELEDARPERAFPDASTFTVEARVGGVSNRFTVYDVDSLADPRYRDLIRRILDIAERHATPAG